MTPTQLSTKLKATPLSEAENTRLYRAISWLKSAEKQEDNLDLKFISLWIAFNACNIMQLLVPIIIDIMLENSQHVWGEITYPVVI